MFENHQVRDCSSRVITWIGSEIGDKPPFTFAGCGGQNRLLQHR